MGAEGVYIPRVRGFNMGVYRTREISQGRSPRLISQGRYSYVHNPRTRGRYLSHTMALSVISTVFSSCGTPLCCRVVPLLPCCHSRGGYPVSPVAHSSRRLWAHDSIPRGTPKGCHGDAHAPWYTQPKIIGLDSIPTAVRYRIEDNEELESST